MSTNVFPITVIHYFTLSAIIFAIGVIGILLNRRNLIAILMSIEVMLLAVNIQLVSFSSFQGNIRGHVLSLFVLTVAAAEMAIGLAILVVYFRARGHIRIDDNTELKG